MRGCCNVDAFIPPGLLIILSSALKKTYNFNFYYFIIILFIYFYFHDVIVNFENGEKLPTNKIHSFTTNIDTFNSLH